jgi:flagellar basal body P-ring protein FlgI
MNRQHLLLALSVVLATNLGGCAWLDGRTMRSQSPEETIATESTDQSPRLVGDLAVPTGMHMVRIEAVALVTGLHGQGSDPSPSAQRSELIQEMQKRGVDSPNSVLKSGDVSLVLLQGVLRPGIQKGDRFDIEVRTPAQSETTGLRGGYLLETALSETAILGGQLQHGHKLALAKGSVMVDPMVDPKKDKTAACRGKVLGGGFALKSRNLGLVLTPGNQSVANSARIANVVNRRFNMYEKGIKTGVATARTDQLVDLAVHPRYKDNVARYMQVTRAIALSETPSEQQARAKRLEEELLDPNTSAEAALQLEAIGSEGADALLKGIASKDSEVRFYAAEALAYLDRREAAEPLGQIARDQPAFRVFALTALSTMKEYTAYEQLRDLLSSPSAETRYGAFRALWAMNAKDAMVKGTVLGGQFNYHVLNIDGPAMVHATQSHLPEIVVFGASQEFQTPLALNAGRDIMVTSSGGKEVNISKFTVNGGDQKRTVSTKVDDVIRAIVDVGGTYPDVVQALQEAKKAGALASRFEIDALPAAGRSYERYAEDGQPIEENAETAANTTHAPERPTPELYASKGTPEKPTDANSETQTNNNANREKKAAKVPEPKKGILARLLGRTEE